MLYNIAFHQVVKSFLFFELDMELRNLSSQAGARMKDPNYKDAFLPLGLSRSRTTKRLRRLDTPKNDKGFTPPNVAVGGLTTIFSTHLNFKTEVLRYSEVLPSIMNCRHL
jgi:hypothetical protein